MPSAADLAALHEEGYTWERFPVRIFHDTLDHLPWFYRSSSEVGEVWAAADGGQPADPSAVLKAARDTFGPDVSVMWP